MERNIGQEIHEAWANGHAGISIGLDEVLGNIARSCKSDCANCTDCALNPEMKAEVHQLKLQKTLEESRRERDRVLAYCKESNDRFDRLDIDVDGNAFVNVKLAEERQTVPNLYMFAEQAEENRRSAKVAVDAMSRGEQHTMTDLYGKGWRKKRP
jgi:hypothetical protein